MGLFRKRKEVLVCPKCGSTEKEPAGNMPLRSVPGGGFVGRVLGPKLYKCKSCDHEGAFFLINKSELENFRNELKKGKE